MPRQSFINSPDWTSVLSLLVAIDGMHNSTSWLDMSSAGTTHATCWRAAVVTVLPVASGQERVRRIATEVQWPNVDSADFTSAIYKLLIDHDYRISRELYTQERIPDA